MSDEPDILEEEDDDDEETVTLTIDDATHGASGGFDDD